MAASEAVLLEAVAAASEALAEAAVILEAVVHQVTGKMWVGP